WRIVDPVLKADTPLCEYEPNTWGPNVVEQTVSPAGGWHNPEMPDVSCGGSPRAAAGIRETDLANEFSAPERLEKASSNPMPYQPIENYGIIGNMRTVALIAMNGSIDWYCYPHFDSPSIFGAILDDSKGGRFQIQAVGEDIRYKQLYLPSTNILVTR